MPGAVPGVSVGAQTRGTAPRMSCGECARDMQTHIVTGTRLCRAVIRALPRWSTGRWLHAVHAGRNLGKLTAGGNISKQAYRPPLHDCKTPCFVMVLRWRRERTISKPLTATLHPARMCLPPSCNIAPMITFCITKQKHANNHATVIQWGARRDK